MGSWAAGVLRSRADGRMSAKFGFRSAESDPFGQVWAECGRFLGEPGRNWPNKLPICCLSSAELGRRRHDAGRTQPKLPSSAKGSVKFAQIRPKFGQTRAKSAKFGRIWPPNLPKVVNVGRDSTKLGHSLAGFGRARPEFDRILPELGRNDPSSAEIEPNSADVDWPAA